MTLRRSGGECDTDATTQALINSHSTSELMEITIDKSRSDNSTFEISTDQGVWISLATNCPHKMQRLIDEIFQEGTLAWESLEYLSTKTFSGLSIQEIVELVESRSEQ